MNKTIFFISALLGLGAVIIASPAQAQGCKFGEEKEVLAVSIRANVGAFSTETDLRQEIYNPPNGWVIVSHRKAIISEWGTRSFFIISSLRERSLPIGKFQNRYSIKSLSGI